MIELLGQIFAGFVIERIALGIELLLQGIHVFTHGLQFGLHGLELGGEIVELALAFVGGQDGGLNVNHADFGTAAGCDCAGLREKGCRRQKRQHKKCCLIRAFHSVFATP